MFPHKFVQLLHSEFLLAVKFSRGLLDGASSETLSLLLPSSIIWQLEAVMERSTPLNPEKQFEYHLQVD